MGNDFIVLFILLFYTIRQRICWKKCYDKLNFPSEFVQGIYYYLPSEKCMFSRIFILQYDVFYDKLSSISVFLFL